MGQLVPAAGGNAIVSIAFALEFDQGLDQELVDAIGNSHSLAAALNVKPRKDKEIDVSVTITKGQPASSVQAKDLVRYAFEIPSDMPEKPPRVSMAISTRLIACVFNEYTAWNNIKAEVLRYLEAALSAVPGPPLSATGFTLQVTDQFKWAAPCRPDDLRSCLQASGYLAGHVFEVESLWHSHHGFFTDAPAGTWFARQLDVVEASVIENNGTKERVLNLTMTHRRIARPGVASPSTVEKITQDFEALKQSHNTIFKATLTDDMQRRVGIAG